DAAGNVSNTGSISFNYDATKPTSFVTSPANQQAYITRGVSPITGTAVDEVSTGTPSGLSADFRVGIKRLSDNYWWDGSTWTVTTGGVYESSIAVALGTGLGTKNWSLTLPTTFYDLLGATDTFKIYSWAKDLVNNPSSAVLNMESSTTVKNVFSYASSTPTLTSITPVASTATNVVNSFALNLDPAGGRIVQVWTTFLTTANYYWQGSSWSTVQTTDPPPFSGVWLSTDAQAPGSPSPDMTFTPGSTPDGQSAVTITFTAATSIQMAALTSGARYKIYVRALDTAGHILNTGLNTSTHVFVYDVTAPTITAHFAIMGLSSHSAVYTSMPSMIIASGTVSDNIVDALDQRQVFLRIYDVDNIKYLNPGTLIKFDISDGNLAWSQIDTITNGWAYDLSASQFVSGNRYQLEVYAQDAAGNRQGAGACPVALDSDPNCQTGAAATPKYRRFFAYDKNKPTIAITTPTVTNPEFIGGSYNLTTLSGTAADTGGGVTRVEFSLAINASDPTNHWQHYTTSGAWKNNTVGDIWNTAYPQGPPGDTWSVWSSSNIGWYESESYSFKVRAYDSAGNLSNESSQIFTYDKAKPRSVVAVPSDGARYTTQVLTISGTAVDDTSTSTGTSTGLSTDFGVAVKRQSDNYWWNGSTWSASLSSITVPIGTGVGVKNWSLPLSSTFYDLLTVTVDTFSVYSWATDQVNNPDASYASVEAGSTTPKITYIFEAGAPSVSVVWP
ncbi:MAG: hypothetical protein AAB131_22395, partial [Actinomycetota bacterium]